MVLVVGQNSVWQHTYTLGSLRNGTVNRVDGVFASAAGKGANVSRALGVLGCEAFLIAYAGGPNGEKFRNDCDGDGIRSHMVRIAAETRVCTTLIESAGPITEIVEPAPCVSETERDAYHAEFFRRIPDASFLVISGTAIAGESDDCYLQFCDAAHGRGVPLLLDSYKAHGRRALSASPEILKINEDELEELSGIPCAERSGRAAAARAAIAEYGIRWVIVTRGKAGAEGYDAGSAAAAAAPAVDRVNAIGSGDAFTAGVVSHLVHRQELTERSASGAPFHREGFPWGATLMEAIAEGTAMGTANCLNIKPGRVDEDDYREMRRRVEAVALA